MCAIETFTEASKVVGKPFKVINSHSFIHYVKIMFNIAPVNFLIQLQIDYYTVSCICKYVAVLNVIKS